MNTLIAADAHWALWTVLLGAAALGIWAERTRVGARLSGALVTMLATIALSNLRVIPASAPAYDIVWSYLVPLAIPLLLVRADLRRILREAGPTLIAFAFGAVGTVVGTVIAFHIVPLGDEGWKLAGIFCSTYIGGSINYVATAAATGLTRGDLLSAGVAADNLVMAVYFMILFALPSIGWLTRRFRTHHEDTADTSGETAEIAAAGPRPTVAGILTALAGSAAICAIGFGAASALGIETAGILILTAVAVAVASLVPALPARVAGADETGVVLMQVFFATIGASANIEAVLRVGPILFAFAALILAIHLVTILLGGWIAKLDLAEVVIASNANMGGPTTAAAMAVARRWQALVIPAILCGTLGYATATFIGVAVANLLR